MPAPITGYRTIGYIGAAQETTPGTPVAPSKFYKFLTDNLSPQQVIRNFRDGNVRDVTVAVKETFHHEGGFQHLVYVDEGGAMLAWAMGADTVTGGMDPYTHTLTLADTLPYLSVEKGYFETQAGGLQLVDRLVSCKVTKLVINGKAGSEILFTPEIIGITSDFKGTTPTSQTFVDTPATQGPWMFHQSVFTFTTGFGTDYATIAGQVQDFTLTIDNQVEAVYGPNSLVPIGLIENAREVTLEFSVVFSGLTGYAQTFFGAAAGVAPSATITTGSFTVKGTIAAAPEHSITLVAALADVHMYDIALDPDAKVAIAKFTCEIRRSGSTYPLSAVVMNAQSADYVV